jgi:hypothetical protein
MIRNIIQVRKTKILILGLESLSFEGGNSSLETWQCLQLNYLYNNSGSNPVAILM